MRLLVTGASGFLGRYTLPLLREHGFESIALVRSDRAASIVHSLGATPLAGDLDDSDKLAHTFASADAEALLNIASLGFGHAPAIVQSASKAGLNRCVYVSTTSVETTLNTPSKRVRLAAERAIQQSSASWTIVRPTMIYGAPGDRNIERLLRLLRVTPLIPLPGGGNKLQQPVHVEDLAQSLVSILLAPETIHETFNVAGPQALDFRSLIKEAKKAVGSRAVLIDVPLNAAIWAARAYERISSSPRVKVEQINRLAEDKAFSIEPARRAWGYAPRSFQDGVWEEAAALWPGL